MTTQKTQDLTAAVLFHRKRIADYETYLETLGPEADKAQAENDYNKLNDLEDITEATSQRIKENEEIIRELNDEL